MEILNNFQVVNQSRLTALISRDQNLASWEYKHAEYNSWYLIKWDARIYICIQTYITPSLVSKYTSDSVSGVFF